VQQLRTWTRIAAVVAVIGLLSSCSTSDSSAANPTNQSGQTTLTVLAASSLGPAFTAIADAFEAEQPNTQVTISLGGSSALAAQIRNGAPADVFASADMLAMRPLLSGGQPLVAQPRVFATNTLAIVVPAANQKNIRTLTDLTADGITLAIGSPEVPIGNYAREVFQKADIAVKPDTLEPSASAIVAKASLGEIDAGVVYSTDVLNNDKVRAVTIPTEFNVVATYPIAAVNSSKSGSLAAGFVDFVLGQKGQALLRSFGFGPPPVTG
jgi:molybdate transport system substrate-binding protein